MKLTFLLKQLVILGLLAGPQACKTKQASTKAIETDFSSIRPSYEIIEEENKEGAVRFTIEEEVQEFNHPDEVTEVAMVKLDSMVAFDRALNYVEGYRIQLYTGNDRASVNEIKTSIYKIFPEENIYQDYRHPTYILKMGNFYSRIDAERALVKIRHLLKSPIIVKEKVIVKKD